jgi:hypothetical protein
VKDLGIHHFQECVVSSFECTLQEKYKFSANLDSCNKERPRHKRDISFSNPGTGFPYFRERTLKCIVRDPEFY